MATNGSIQIIFRATGQCIFCQFNLILRFQSQNAYVRVRAGSWSAYVRARTRRIGLSSQNALRLNYIIVFSRSRDHSFAMDFIEVIPNRSDISRKKAYLSPLLRSRSTGKCSVRTIFLSSSEIGSWPRQFPRENCRAKDVWVFVVEESDTCSEGSPICSPFGSNKQL